jgi:Arc/MetJ-type ribon-helix-helix transcriptional regulator
MSDEDMVATTVRLPQSQIDALDDMADADEIPNRSEGIRAAIGYALDSDDWEVSTDAAKLAKFQRTKRLSKVHFYREGFGRMVRRVLGSVASTSPAWDPETVERALPKIFGEQIDTLFDTDERKSEAWDTLEAEIEDYREAWDETDAADDGNPYLALLSDDESDDWEPEWKPDVADLADDAADLLDAPGNDAETVETALRERKNVDADLAATAVSRALQDGDDAQGGVPSDD